MNENFPVRTEIVKKSLDAIVEEIAQIQNERYGEILNPDSSIKMESFSGLEGFNVAEDQAKIKEQEINWSDAQTTDPNRLAFFKDQGLDTPQERLNDWQEKKETSETEKLEKAILYVFHKFLHSEFIVARASVYDDYFNGVDTVIVDAKTQKVVGAFDEVRGAESFERNQDKMKKVIKKASTGGAHLKYGINFEEDSTGKAEQKIVRKELFHVPLFMVSLSKEDLTEFLNGMNGQIEGSNTAIEGKVFNQILDSFEEQIKILKDPEKKIKSYIGENIKSFEETLERMRRLGEVNNLCK